MRAAAVIPIQYGRMKKSLLLLVLLSAYLGSCTSSTVMVGQPNEPLLAAVTTPATATATAAEDPSPPATAITATETAVPPTAVPTPIFTPTPFYTGERTAACGQLLPLRLTTEPPTATYNFNQTAADITRDTMPDIAQPAFDYILANPEDVSLVVFRMGDEANGIYLNEDVPRPLASVAKLIHLIAYVEAAEAGEINPATRVPLETLERFYLPGSDLGSHQRALQELESSGRIDAGGTIALQDVAWMMLRYSSNAATDYIHYLLGQERLEQTVLDLGLQDHTAPCPFLAQFLAMDNPVRVGGAATLSRYTAEPTLYAADSGLLADAFINDSRFRDAIGRWRAPIQTQRTYVSTFGTYGRASDYAQLMRLIAQNGLSSPESSFQARRLIEWPMVFSTNQNLFTNLGYKDGNLPGVLTTAYYAYPRDGSPPVVVILFYHDLPQDLYRAWRRSLTHDEFARWLLSDPAALARVRVALNGQ